LSELYNSFLQVPIYVPHLWLSLRDFCSI